MQEGGERAYGVSSAPMLPAPGGGLLEMGFGEGRRLRTAAAVADALDGLALRHCGGGDGC